MKELIKKLLPAAALDAYHRLLSWAAALRYGRPSERLVVIGVTGTNGKSTVCNMTARILEAAGHKVGMTTTANFKIAEQEWLNDTKMTMLGRFALQRLLRRMVDAGCTHAVVETSSEGIRQHRQAGINYDVAVFTNLTPEHIESHGGFDNYKAAKGRLFAGLTSGRRKEHDGRAVPKTAVVNLASEHAPYFLGFPADRKFGFVVQESGFIEAMHDDLEVLEANSVDLRGDGSSFSVEGVGFVLNMPGRFNVENALAAVTACRAVGVDLEIASIALRSLSGVPGRMERIDEGQDFTVVVDYAPEPESFRRLYEVIATLPKRRVIHVLGSCGGGRDRDRRPVLGCLAAEGADLVIVTNEDPYDDDPQEIIDDVAAGARECGKMDGKDLFTPLDRGEAIDLAVSLAESGDLVVVTGKGCEQAMVVAGGRKVPWDDRERLRRAIRNRLTKENLT